MTVETMRSRFYAVATRMLEEDPNVAVVLADIGGAGFTPRGNGARSDRVINVGIREQLMMGVAAGLALDGYHPIVHSYAPFLIERPYEQIKLDLGHQDVAATLVSIGASYDSSASGRTHQAPSDVALIGALPEWTIRVPGHPDEVEDLVRRAVASGQRTYLRLSGAQNARRVAMQHDRFTIVRRGSAGAPTVIAVGPMLDRVIAACVDRDVTLLYAATVRPFDAATLRAVLGAPEVVLVEPYLAGTSAAEVSGALTDRPHRMLALGVHNVEHRRYGTPGEHDVAHGLDVAGIRRSLDAFLDPNAPCAAGAVA